MSRPARLILGSYNVHGGIGTDGQYDPDRIAQVISELDADVVALQEVGQPPGRSRSLLQSLDARLDMRVIAGPTMQRSSGDYGNAIFTRVPVRQVRRVDISVAGREPRGALDVSLEWRGLHLQVVATHLGLRPGERREQVRRILPLFERAGADRAVLMGDLNEWMLWGRPLRWLRRHFAPTPNPRTWPSRWPVFSLDQLLLRPRARLDSLTAHRSAAARLASDHLPLRAVMVE